MFISEMHIYVKQALQNLNSNLFRGYKDAQIDLFLNRSMSVYWTNHYLPKIIESIRVDGFELSEKRFSDLANLSIDYYSDSCYIALDKDGNPQRMVDYNPLKPVKFMMDLPEDFAILTGQQAKVFYNLCDDISFDIDETTFSFSDINYITNPSVLGANTITSISYSLPNPAGGVYSGSILASSDSIPWNEFSFPEDAIHFRNQFLAEARKKFQSFNYDIFWERYKGIFKPNSFIIISNYSVSSSATITFNTAAFSRSFQTTSYKDVSVDTTTGSYKLTKAEKRSHNVINASLNNSFGKPNHEKILVTQSERFLELYTADNVVIEEAVISYIRNPKPMSKALNQSCELAEHTHIKICDMTVEYIKGVDNHPNFQKIAIENQKTD